MRRVVDCDWLPDADAAQTAHEDVAGARAVAAEGHVRRVLQQVVERLDVELLELLTADRLHRDRHVLKVLGAALRRDHDLRSSPPVAAAGVVSAC